MSKRLVLAIVMFLAGCPESGSSNPGIDATGPFPPPPDADPMVCEAGTVLVIGELVDLDSSLGAFEGVFGAKLSVAGNPIVSTPPNGRLDMCAPLSFPLRFDLDAPAEFLDGSLVLTEAALRGLRPLSLRAIKSARAVSFYAERGLTFDASRAHVLVFQAGDTTDLTLDRPHGAAQVGDEDVQGVVTWRAGSAGRYVLFPNVDVAQATGTIGGDLGGVLPVALTAGELTIVATSMIFR